MNIEVKIAEIEQAISKNKNIINGCGLNEGILGLSFFYYYMYKYSGNEKFLHNCIEFYEDAIDKIDNSYSSFNYKADLVELGLYSILLSSSNIIEIPQHFFSELDNIILEFTIKNQDLSNYSGALLGGCYFIERENFSDRLSILKSIVDLIESQAITNSSGTYWISSLKNENKVGLNLSHGTAGIISFLIKLYNSEIEQARCKSLIINGLKFILDQKKEGFINLLPLHAFEKTFVNYANLMYGDLGVGYVLIKGGEIVKDDTFVSEGLNLIINSIDKKEIISHNIKEASLMYGSAGISSLYKSLYEDYNLDKLKEGYQYWDKKTEDFADTSNKWAGFNVHFKFDTDDIHLSFAHGISGIGISLISSINGEQSKDYLKFLKYDI